MELVRLTAIDENCKTLLDELVFPSHMIVDLNTRYSGIQTLAGATHNLESVRKELFKYVDANTILLGHGLENDMNALRVKYTIRQASWTYVLISSCKTAASSQDH